MSAVIEISSAIGELQNAYIEALDNKDMHGWLATFDESAEASYILTTLDNEQQGLPLGLMLDDCHARLEDRVTFITKIWAGTFQDYRTRHVVQQTSCSMREQDIYEMRSNFSVFYTPTDTGQTNVLACGIYLDTVCILKDGARFISKKAVTDTSILPQYLVYPL
jgi:salicylate 5-hydroxylase small subunit